MSNVVLVGDSIFDNAAYTEGGPDVVSQVRGLLPPGWEATLLAVDGSTTHGVAAQLGGLPADIASDFERRYRVAVAACLDTDRPLAVCTIYNGCFDDQVFQRLASTTLRVFNDAIIRVAIEHALPVIDLRSVCATRADYANPIEPSSVGGEKIARVIVGLVCGARTTAPVTRIVVA